MDELPESNEPSNPEPAPDEAPVEGMEMSLNELGRAYARAVGLIPDASEADREDDPGDDRANDESVCPVSRGEPSQTRRPLADDRAYLKKEIRVQDKAYSGQKAEHTGSM